MILLTTVLATIAAMGLQAEVPAQSAVPVRVTEGEQGCIAEWESQRFELLRGRLDSAGQKRAEAALAKLAGRKATLRIAPADVDAVSYRCLGGLIYLAQKAGVDVAVPEMD